jgi:hypothetical protein
MQQADGAFERWAGIGGRQDGSVYHEGAKAAWGTCADAHQCGRHRSWRFLGAGLRENAGTDPEKRKASRSGSLNYSGHKNEDLEVKGVRVQLTFIVQ